MDDPDEPDIAEALLVVGGFSGIACAFLVIINQGGVQLGARQGAGILAGLALAPALRWWLRVR